MLYFAVGLGFVFVFVCHYRGIRGCIVVPLCKAIEDDLRLHIHTKHLGHMQALNPKADMLRLLRYIYKQT